MLKLLPLHKSEKLEKNELNGEGLDFLKVLNSKHVDDTEQIVSGLEGKVKAQLRDYQKNGIAWIMSLTEFGFNCALCDDMGLGKTIQSLCAVLLVKQKEMAIRGR